MVRVDNANLPRGVKIVVTIIGDVLPLCTIHHYSTANFTVEPVVFEAKRIGHLWNLELLSPNTQGFLLISIGSNKVVKKIGNPTGLFVLGVNSSLASVSMEQLNALGGVIMVSMVQRIVEGFFVLELLSSCTVVKTVGKYFDIRKAGSTLGFDVDVDSVGITLQDITIPQSVLANISLPEISLPPVSLQDVGLLDVVLPLMTIVEV